MADLYAKNKAAAIDAQIKALRVEIKRLTAQRDAYKDLAGPDTTDDSPAST
jgi:uncharacterized small protein (DUF1192 family)